MNLNDDLLQYSDMAADKMEVVTECVKRCPPGYFLEVGTRKGGSALNIIKLMSPESTLISVDPYGSKKYIDYQGVDTPFDFPDSMYLEALWNLSSFAIANERNFVQYKMTSEDFLNAKFNYWHNSETTPVQDIKFSFVLLDGDHTDKTVGLEIEKLQPRMVTGGIILIDNTDWLALPLDGWVKSRFDMAYKVF